MKKSNFLISLLIGSMILLTAGQGLARSFVLCIGEGDHLAIEQAVTGKCHPAGLPDHEHAEPSCANDHCGPCQDIKASVNFLNGRSRLDLAFAHGLLPPAFFALPPFIFASNFSNFSSNHFAQPPPWPSQPLLALHTTVLLI